jgi:hypothetical protein
LGFEQVRISIFQNLIEFTLKDNSVPSYGHIHIPMISLKEIPVQREQLRLKLSYGGKKSER